MSIKITLFVDDLEFNVLDFFFGFFQNSDYTGRPTNKPNAYPFKFTIEASRDTTFYEWAIHPTMQKRRVKIVFSPINGMSKSTTIELLDVYCLFCKYDFIATGNQPFVVNFYLSPATIIRDGIVLMKRYWAVTDPAMLNQKQTLVGEDKQEEKKIIDYYITDLNNKRVDKILAGDKILLNIHSKNMIDELFTIKLTNQTIDFKYNGDVLVDDTLSDYKISSNQEKIELEAIKQEV